MLRVEHRQLFRPNGLIDDFVVHGGPEDYVAFSGQVMLATQSHDPVVLACETPMHIEISRLDTATALFTSLQNEANDYLSMEAWANRRILRETGTGDVLERLALFLSDIANRGHGYSYISEFSSAGGYSAQSPEWRLHVR